MPKHRSLLLEVRFWRIHFRATSSSIAFCPRLLYYLGRRDQSRLKQCYWLSVSHKTLLCYFKCIALKYMEYEESGRFDYSEA